jgi:hypothetical protein
LEETGVVARFELESYGTFASAPGMEFGGIEV